MRYLKPKYRDVTVIPDKYNTGSTGNLEIANSTGLYCGVEMAYSEYTAYNGIFTTQLGLEFFYRNKSITSATITNIDFTVTQILSTGRTTQDRVEITFINCRFNNFISHQLIDSKVHFTFINCDFKYITNSNFTCIRCRFGENGFDCIDPLNNVIIKDCFIRDLSRFHPLTFHYDGTHICGSKAASDDRYRCKNIHFQNVRMEIPRYPIPNCTSSVNACIMLYLEYADGEDITFDNCIVNGGGYSIYASSKGVGKHVCTNSHLDNISVGYAKQYETFYQRPILEGVTLGNIYDTTYLYVSSVFQKEDKLHVITSNDTETERKLIVITNNGKSEFLIPACYSSKDDFSHLPDGVQYSDYPFDIDITLDKAEWIVCYDSQIDYNLQIRFVNFTDDQIPTPEPEQYLSNELLLLYQSNLYVPESIAYYDYIKNNGKACIDFNSLYTHENKIEIAFTTISQNTCWILGTQSNSLNYYGYRALSNNKIQDFYGSNNNTFFCSPEERHLIIRDNNKTYLDGILVNENDGTVDITRSISLFAYKTSEKSYVYSAGEIKIHRITFYSKEGIITQDFRPCIYYGNIGVYDGLTKTFLKQSDGTGTLTVSN